MATNGGPTLPVAEVPSELKEAIPEDLEANSSPVQYHCDYCKRDLSNNIRIRCATCSDFDLCLHCFVIGVELRDHLNSHDYRIIDNMHFPFLDANWSADEEQLMLEGLEKYGLGNWLDVAEEISTKTKMEAKNHYEKYYFGSEQWPLPDYSNPLADRKRVQMLNSGLYNKTVMPEGVIVKKELVAKKDKDGPKPTPPKDPKTPGNLTGYMPMRDEFETEMFATAEKQVMDVMFLDEDTPEERKMKDSIVLSYDWKLRERARARKFVVERRLHDTKYQDKISKMRDPESAKAHNKLKHFMQVFSNGKDYEQFLSGRAKQARLMADIVRLQTYRKRGITSLEEGKTYDEEKKRREMDRNGDQNVYSNKLKRKQSKPLDLSGQDGVELLTKQEKLLCESFHLRPQQYFVCKEAILREYVQSGNAVLAKGRAQQLVDMEPSKIDKVYSFLIHVGWVNNQQHSSSQQRVPVPQGRGIGGRPPTQPLKRRAAGPPVGVPPASKRRKK
eukprot:TRINITY_DN4501_c0_g1_i1.p1 TRINITY_DN4501_c0_g1~~TRINITY_DN4501_c0_g1_i1.p1  ORF type:complete len:534 (+),score=89.88 TRINITY_DN4501_c0_g1_i1:100-1602(+)